MISINGSVVDFKRFPDKTLLLRDIRIQHDVCRIEWRYGGDEELFLLICIAKHLKECGKRITLFLPYIPNARFDRCNDPGDVFTLKHFASIINDIGFERVYVLDPHSSVAPALINRCSIHHPEQMIWAAIQKIGDPELALFYPDEGSMKRYSCLVKKPFGFGIKNRDWNTGKILGLQVIGAESLKNKNVLIVDDICSRGGTFFYSAKALKEAGAKDVYLYVTHCENTIFEGELLDGDLIKHVYTTNSIFTGEHDKISVLRLKGGE